MVKHVFELFALMCIDTLDAHLECIVAMKILIDNVIDGSCLAILKAILGAPVSIRANRISAGFSVSLLVTVKCTLMAVFEVSCSSFDYFVWNKLHEMWTCRHNIVIHAQNTDKTDFISKVFNKSWGLLFGQQIVRVRYFVSLWVPDCRSFNSVFLHFQFFHNCT